MLCFKVTVQNIVLGHTFGCYSQRLDFNRTYESLVPGEHRVIEGGCLTRDHFSFFFLRDDISS